MTTNAQLRLTILFCLLSAMAAAAEDLNLRTGLWEMTTTISMAGNPYPQATAAQQAEMDKAIAGMTPEQRAQMAQMQSKMAEAMKNVGNQPPSVRKDCLTPQALKEMSQKFDPKQFGAGKDDMSCKPVVLKSSATIREVRFECSGKEQKLNLTMSVLAPNPETFSMSMDGSSSGPQISGTAQSKVRIAGKWLSADCGAYKP